MQGNLLTVVPSQLNLLDRKRDVADKDPHILTVRSLCSCFSPLRLIHYCRLSDRPTHQPSLAPNSNWSTENVLGGVTPPETSMTRSSPATRLPLDLIETIVAYIFYDTPSLCACTMTCYSRHSIAVPYLHRTLTVETYSRVRNSR